MSDQNLPKDEITGGRNLVGKYRVSFLIDLREEDGVYVSDINQSLAEGFGNESTLYRITKVDVEKLDKKGNSLGKKIKAGDRVRLILDAKVTAFVNYEEPYYVFGKKKSSLESVGKSTAIIPEGMTATVNKVSGNDVELIDFEDVISVPMHDQDLFEDVPTTMDVDIVAVEKSLVEKVD